MSSEKVLSISAIFISICALAVSIWQGVVEREHNRLSLTPYIEVSPRLAGRSQSGIFIENAGTGAAFIKYVNISSGGKLFKLTEDNWSDFFQHIGVNKDCYKKSWIKPGSVLQPSKEIPLITVSEASMPICDLDAVKFLTEPGLTLKIVYESPYKEEFVFLDDIEFDKSSVANLEAVYDLLNKYNTLIQPTVKGSTD